MRPAIRSTFDVVAWLEAREAPDHAPLTPAVLMKLLYVCQAIYASEHDGAKLMPATFLATDVGPIEPDLFLALEQGMTLAEPVAPSDQVEELLLTVWMAYGAGPEGALDSMLAGDTAIAAARKRGRNSELLLDDMVNAYPGGLSSLQGRSAISKFPDGSAYNLKHSNLDAAPSHHQEVRFTADGRSVTRWMPKKRVRSKDIDSARKI